MSVIMVTLFERMLEEMDRSFRVYEAGVPAPQWVDIGGENYSFRYIEQNIHQALVLKLAFIQSTLRAALLLFNNGYILQQAMLQRVIQEATEDVTFLTIALLTDGITPLHERFLKTFWQAEFDKVDDPLASTQKRDMVPRQKIRSYLANRGLTDMDPRNHIELLRTISNAYSGFIHGAAEHIMELYEGDPATFHTKSIAGTSRTEQYLNDFWNYNYRGFLAHISVGRAFGAENLVRNMIRLSDDFEERRGMNK